VPPNSVTVINGVPPGAVRIKNPNIGTVDTFSDQFASVIRIDTGRILSAMCVGE
jgi:hypothetical protein